MLHTGRSSCMLTFHYNKATVEFGSPLERGHKRRPKLCLFNETFRVCTLQSPFISRRGSTIGFHLLWHTVELAMSTRLCLLLWFIWFLCFRFDALTELGAFMRTEFLCIFVLRVASGPRVKLASCKSSLTPPPPPPPMVYSTDRSKAVVAVLVLLFVALWVILWGDLLYVLPCFILF